MAGNIIGVDLKLDQNYIEAAVQEIVQAGIVQALGDPTRIVKDAVGSIVNKRVDSDGKVSSSSYSSMPYLDWLAKKTIEDVVRETMRNVLESKRAFFVEEIERQLSDAKFRSDMCAAFVKSVLSASESAWRMPVAITFDPPKGD